MIILENYLIDDVNDEADLIFSDSMWDIYVPKTYSASCTLGEGTSWYTAYNYSYYKYYTLRGNLYVFINKRNPSEKYQLHVVDDIFVDVNDDSYDLYKVLDTDKKLKNFVLSELYKYVETFIYDGKSEVPYDIGNLIIDENVTSIEDFAFKEQRRLETVEAPNVTSIGKRVFYRCRNLRTVKMLNVNKIEACAFSFCSHLTTIKMPNVTSIGVGAFVDCCNLTTINILKVTSIGKEAFSGCGNLTTVNIPNVTSIGEETFGGCDDLTTINIPKVTSIGKKAFWNCYNLTTVNAPNVTSIEDYAFEDCSNLTILDLPNVTSIGKNAFWNCNNLTIIVSDKLDTSNIPDYVKVVRKGMNEHR